MRQRSRRTYSEVERRTSPLGGAQRLLPRHRGDRLRHLPQVSERVDALEDPVAVGGVGRFGGDRAALGLAVGVGGCKIVHAEPQRDPARGVRSVPAARALWQQTAFRPVRRRAVALIPAAGASSPLDHGDAGAHGLAVARLTDQYARQALALDSSGCARVGSVRPWADLSSPARERGWCRRRCCSPLCTGQPGRLTSREDQRHDSRGGFV